MKTIALCLPFGNGPGPKWVCKYWKNFLFALHSCSASLRCPRERNLLLLSKWRWSVPYVKQFLPLPINLKGTCHPMKCGMKISPRFLCRTGERSAMYVGRFLNQGFTFEYITEFTPETDVTNAQFVTKHF